jgi:hypothetical protein
MKRSVDACILTGIPTEHADAFQEVANRENCMIASRAVGKYATGLILESYSSKGFHNKAKSCNWGPMAGFVLVDSRFTKALDTSGQQKDVANAIQHGATKVDLIISLARIKWLMKEGIYLPAQDGPDAFVGFAAKEGLRLMFRLKRAPAVGPDLFAVEYKSANRDWVAVQALRDSMATVPFSDYRSATTGDYDLFAVYAQSKNYNPDLRDRRMVSHAALENNIRAGANPGEDPHLGNVTPRIMEIRIALNTAILRRGYTGGNMIHHSDEGGRPFVNDIDLPVFAVVPGQSKAYGIENVEDLREFISVTLGAAYAPMFNPGWMKELTHVGPGGISPEELLMKKSLLRPPLK